MTKTGDYAAVLSTDEVRRATLFVHHLDAAKGAYRPREWSDTGRDVFVHRVRSKCAELFVGALLDVPVDWMIRPGSDGGLDTVYRGHGVQVKSTASRKVGTGPPWFRMGVHERDHADSPGWDMGLLVQASVTEPRAFALVGWLTRSTWLLRREWYVRKPHPDCWAVRPDYLEPPDRLQYVAPRVPPRAWPPSAESRGLIPDVGALTAEKDGV